MKIMAEETSRSNSPLEEIQRTFFGFVHETILLKDELKKSQDKVSELEKQVETANETIRIQQGQLFEAADIIKELETLEKKANQTIEQLKSQLGEKRKELEPEVTIANESELKGRSNLECDNNRVGILILAESGPNSPPVDNNEPTLNSENETHLQLIVTNLHKNVHEFTTQERKRKRRKALNKIINETAHLVECLSIVISGEGSNSSLPMTIEYDHIEVECTTPQASSSLRPISTDSEGINGRISMTSKHGVDFGRNFYCICGHKSINRNALFKHIKVKSQGNPFRCEMCSHRSRDTTDLNLHYRRVHHVKRSYANGCAGCGNIYATRKDLLRHKYKDRCNNLPWHHD